MFRGEMPQTSPVIRILLHGRSLVGVRQEFTQVISLEFSQHSASNCAYRLGSAGTGSEEKRLGLLLDSINNRRVYIWALVPPRMAFSTCRHNVD